MNKRWSIWIDIEGFSKLWEIEGLGLSGLQSLMLGIFEIGTSVYPNPEQRLFAHQFGDGFVIVSTFEEEDLSRCVSIAIALMRGVARSGCVARAAISEGQFSDIQGCWPKVIRDKIDGDRVFIGHGLMTFIPVMGTALINSNKLDHANRLKGALLTIESCNVRRLASSFSSQESPDCTNHHLIDWVHSRSDDLDRILASVPMCDLTCEQLEVRLRDNMARWTLPATWIENTLRFNQIAV